MAEASVPNRAVRSESHKRVEKLQELLRSRVSGQTVQGDGVARGKTQPLVSRGWSPALALRCARQ